MNTYHNMSKNQGIAAKSMERLSTGLRINKGSDDPAGLSISEKMRSQIRGLDQATRNAQDGISMLQTAEGGLQVGQDILQRMNELAVQASTSTLGDDERAGIAREVNDLIDELDKISTTSQFNGHKLLDGSLEMNLAVDSDGGGLDVSIGSMNSSDLGETATLSSFKTGGTNATLSVESAKLLKSATTEAMKEVSSQRSAIGAKQNRLEHTINYNQVASENLTSAESRIRDVDVAKEMMKMTKHQILADVSQAMMAQVQKQQYSVLQLIRQ